MRLTVFLLDSLGNREIAALNLVTNAFCVVFSVHVHISCDHYIQPPLPGLSQLLNARIAPRNVTYEIDVSPTGKMTRFSISDIKVS